MADFPIPEKPEFNETMKQLTSQDRASFDVFNPMYETLLENDHYLKEREDRITGILLVKLPASDWSTAAPYTQTVKAQGVTESDNPLLIKCTTGAADLTAYMKQYSYIDMDGETGNGTLTFRCSKKKPTIDLLVGLKGV